ncbi:UPF0149 family protein [Psychromonas sp. RZ22]|uniref:UPF0149 family protein n=1 Tax=Psychromonas algarum TaxID=2555643 RepID=UPI00106780D0|nr:UPF0149 family protein [Psychromonas sp. RZ22]TEW55994.1 UPF0149 family protein [Psychromonas sp. RZ22]
MHNLTDDSLHDHQNSVFMDFIHFNKTHPLTEQLQPAYYQLGFICSIQAIPEGVDLEQWLSYLWRDGVDISFTDEQQATEYAQRVLNLVAHLQSLYAEATSLDELNCQEWLDNDALTVEAVEFAAGYLAAIECFNEQWLVTNEDENTQNLLQTSILLLSKLAPSEEVDQQLLDLFEQLPDFAEILQILPQLLTNLAYCAAQVLNIDE